LTIKPTASTVKNTWKGRKVVKEERKGGREDGEERKEGGKEGRKEGRW
jgi:hypothetical protein